MTIDLNIAEGNDAGKLQLGVIEVSGTTMTGNLGTPGAQDRPAKDIVIRSVKIHKS